MPYIACALLLWIALFLDHEAHAQANRTLPAPTFAPHLFDKAPHPGGQAVAWADYDQDGHLDLVVGFKDQPVQFYRYSEQGFQRAVTPPALAHNADYRSLAWGDYNRDGYPDLYVGFGRDAQRTNLLLRGGRKGFTEVSADTAVDTLGTSRQATWLDYDADGDSDLFVAMRDRTSRLFQNQGEQFTNVSRSSGLADPRRSVGAVWFDYDWDGDLDLYLPNQSGDRDGFYENRAGQFVDVARTLKMDLATRPLQEGSVGATVCDFNGDGHLDIFVPVYGANMLWMSNGRQGFVEQAEAWGVADVALAVGADCGDLNNDARADLVVVAYERGVAHGHDRIYINQGSRFVDHFPSQHRTFDGDHGVRMADYDDDGDLDFVTTNRHTDGTLTLWENHWDQANPGPNATGAFLKVWVLDEVGFYTRQGDEVRAYDTSSGALVYTSMVDTGGGYISQNMLPVHLGLGQRSHVHLEVTSLAGGKRQITRLDNVQVNQTITVKVALN